MPKKSNPKTGLIVLALIVVAAIGVYLWQRAQHKTVETPAVTPAASTAAVSNAVKISADKIDPANEGRVVEVDGDLIVRLPARDTQLGVSADAVMLLRFAEMLQWRERCAGQRCDYQQVWSPQLINSSKFKDANGHKNPERLPITSARFSAGETRLGAFSIDAAVLGNYRLGASLQTKPVAYPVTSAQLPSNLGLSFRDSNGVLYAGDPDHRAIGDVRVSYRIIPAGKMTVTGTQRGDRIVVQKSAVSDSQP